jgi:hypothetical protein
MEPISKNRKIGRKGTKRMDLLKFKHIRVQARSKTYSSRIFSLFIMAVKEMENQRQTIQPDIKQLPIKCQYPKILSMIVPL